MNQQNQYSSSFCEHYDLFMEAGYYDHDAVVEALVPLLHKRKKILELGVGTGLLAGRLADKGFDMTGIDHTPDMIEICKRKGLDEKVRLILGNILKFDAGETFEAAVAEGGIWYFEQTETGNCYLSSHLREFPDNLEGLMRVASHLEPEGLLIIGIQPAHRNLSLLLPDGGTYSQEVEYKRDLGVGFIIEKDYLFHDNNGNQTAHHHNSLRRFNRDVGESLTTMAGITPLGIDETDKFVVFRKE